MKKLIPLLAITLLITANVILILHPKWLEPESFASALLAVAVVCCDAFTLLLFIVAVYILIVMRMNNENR